MKQRPLLLLTALMFTASASAQQPQPATSQIPNVIGQPRQQALVTLRNAGFANVQVIFGLTNGARADTVILQTFVPAVTGAVAVQRQLALVVGQPRRPVPDVRSWRADHALQYLKDLGMGTQIRGGRADSSHVVSTQRPGPGGVSATVLVDLAPIRRDTVRVTIVDTLRIRVVDTLRLTRFDTLFVDRVVQDTVFVDRVRTVSDTTRDTVFIERVSGDTSAGNSAGSNDCIPLFVVGLATLGGLGLGGLGASRILPRLRPPPSTRPGGSSPPADNAVPERDPKSLDVSAFDPVVIDEAVWVTHGTAHTRERES